MAEIDIQPGPLAAAGFSCAHDVLPSVRSAARVLDGGGGTPTSGMAGLHSASAVVTCVQAWADAFGDAGSAMQAVSGKLAETANVVAGTDVDLADLYRGAQGEIPDFAVIHIS